MNPSREREPAPGGLDLGMRRQRASVLTTAARRRALYRSSGSDSGTSARDRDSRRGRPYHVTNFARGTRIRADATRFRATKTCASARGADRPSSPSRAQGTTNVGRARRCRPETTTSAAATTARSRERERRSVERFGREWDTGGLRPGDRALPAADAATPRPRPPPKTSSPRPARIRRRLAQSESAAKACVRPSEGPHTGSRRSRTR